MDKHNVQTPTERHMITTAARALTNSDLHPALEALTALAAYYIQHGRTQEGADILAVVLRQPHISAPTRRYAHDLFEDLETRICPRVIYDARQFAQAVTLEDMAAYVLAQPDDRPSE